MTISALPLPRRVRSITCARGEIGCQVPDCGCLCHRVAGVARWDGFAQAARKNGKRTLLDEPGRDLAGGRGPFRFGYAGEPRPMTLEDLLGRTR